MTDTTAETWLPIPGHPGYEVSDHGRVRSVYHVVMRSNGAPQTVRGRVLRPMRNPKGYLWV
jgi:hypothetical protein